MAHTQDSAQSVAKESNGISESVQIQQLQAERQRLRQALAKTEKERDIYLKAVYAHERAKFLAEIRPEDVDFDELEKASAVPVEFLE